MASQKLIDKTFMTLNALYPSHSQAAEDLQLVIVAWRNVLADVPDNALEAAVDEYIKSDAEFLPTPGKLRAAAIKMLGSNAQTRAIHAWGKILDSNFGREPIDDPLAVRVIREMGGFQAWGNSRVEDVDWWRKHFIELYIQLSEIESAEAKQLGGGQTPLQLDK